MKFNTQRNSANLMRSDRVRAPFGSFGAKWSEPNLVGASQHRNIKKGR